MVSDQALTSEAVRAALAVKGFRLLGLLTPDTLTHARDLARAIEEFHPDVGLLLEELDDPLHFRDAMAVLRSVESVAWLLLTGATDKPRWGAGIEAGASAVLPMSIGLDELAAALLRLAAGREVVSEVDRAHLLSLWQEQNAQQRALAERVERLTRREMEILRLLSQGRSVAQIAASGGVSVDTVRGQVKSVLRKLGVNSQLAAVAVLQQLSQ